MLDTNILVSAVIANSGPPRRLLDHARAQVFELCSSATLLAELLEVLSRRKFAARLTEAGLTPQRFVVELHRLALIATPQDVPAVIANDPDDDHVLACALAAQVDFIVSGDQDLHSLGGQYQGIPILYPAQALQRIASR
ncbi:MAG: putative toxin-antitoxin system toxin component, PIN family [Betaproteobacteria bacterium]|nr:putative toxin-antitoxin system toxin component, PIN family [Betaproteobacteria bacterium]